MRNRGRAGIFPAGVFVFLLIGCGGGGGGNQTPFYGRTYASTGATRAFSLSVDRVGRFTVVARDTAALPEGAGGQGSMTSDGQFSAISEDGKIQFSGTASSDGAPLSGVVRKDGTALFAFSATSLPQTRVIPDTMVGTYSSTVGSDSLYFTISPEGHATLWARVSGATGGGLMNVSEGGVLQSDDNQHSGSLLTVGDTTIFRLTRLNGTARSIDFPVLRTSRAKWTFMVFLNAANDLQPFAALNVNQMEKIGSSSDINIVVQWKQANCSSCGSPEWTGTRRYYVTKDNDTALVHSELVENLGGSVNMGDWRELRNFILWSQQRYPADRYALVIWNHGAGWRPTRNGKRLPVFPRSVSIDDSTRSEIQIWDLPLALDVNPKMDMVIFDASLMQMTEVAYEIRNLAQVMVGSEESPPGEGYVYDTFLRDLADKPTMSSVDFGKQIVIRTLEAYGTNGDNTQSIVDLSKMQNVADRLNAFAVSLLANVSNSRQAMIDARNQAENFQYPENKDLWHYAQLIKTKTSATDLQSAATDLQNALSEAILLERHGNQHPNAHGLAIYVPSPSGYLASYANLALARVTEWDRWLQNQP